MGKNNALSALWRIVWPKRLGDQGSFEIGAMFALCLLRVWIMNTMSQLVGLLDRNMMTRNQNEFWRLWRLSFIMAMIASIHRQTYKFFESSLGKIWHEKLVNLVHTSYFKASTYYAIAQGGAEDGKVEIPDPDERISSDISQVANQMSLVFCEALYTSTAGVFFAYKLGRLYGLRYALAPYIYIVTAFALAQKLFPVNWGKLRKNLRKLQSSYREGHQRLQTHHEAIRALNGEEYEKSELNSSLNKLVNATKEFNGETVLSSAADQLFFYWWLRTFVGWFVIGPHILAPRRARDLTKLSDIANLRGSVGHQFVLFVQSMIAAGVTAKMLRQLQKLAGPASRVHELLKELKDLGAERRRKDDTIFKEGDFIAFDEVTVQTPTGITLVKDLSFRLEKGKSLLITGHNGAGKSSIFRVLGGLWKAKGKITKPQSSESGLHQDVFYLPQKPYNVLGTLKDQISYPKKLSREQSISDLQLEALLRQVSLEYLMEREIEEETNWEAVLSLGEKQRLAIASLLYHKPKFAILDECTSALDTEMERKLYAICSSHNITYITISHRPALQAYHDMMLKIGIGNNGYTLMDLPEKTIFKPGFLDYDIKSQLKTSSKLVDYAKKEKHKRSFVEQLKSLMVLGLDNTINAKLALYLIGTIAQCRLMIEHTLITSGMMGCVFSTQPRDIRRKEFLSLCAWGTIYSLAVTLIEEGIDLLQAEMRTEFYNNLVSKLQRKYLEQNRYYNMVELDVEVKDPAQRIASDTYEFCEKLFDMLPVAKPIVELAWFSYKVHSLVGIKATSAFAAYLAIGSFVIRSIMPNFRHLVNKERELEGKFKYVHGRIKTHAESIAFFGGDEREKQIADSRFRDLMTVNWERLKTNWSFGLFNQAIVREAPMLVQWLLRNQYSQQSFPSDDKVIADAGRKLNYDQLFLFNATNYTFEAISLLLASQEKVANLSGLLCRVSEFHDALEECPMTLGNAQKSRMENSSALSVENLDLCTPKGDVLARGISVQVEAGSGLIVTGRTGAGKTAFFRIIGGLWHRNSEAEISLPFKNGKADIWLVPQRVYCPPGNLADQITYPLRLDKRTKEDESRLLGILQDVGIPYMVDRQNGWDKILKWEDVLSLGEQQRLGMARLFFHKPMFGILDECTSAVSIEAEEFLYRRAKELGITSITISQRLALDQFHTQELKLGDVTSPTGWRLLPLTRRKDQS